MAITVVNSPLKLPATAATAGAGNAAAASASASSATPDSAGSASSGFAALLLGQLGIAVVSPQLAADARPAVRKSDDPASEDGLSATDSSQLLATLGLISPDATVVRPSAGATLDAGDSAQGGAIGDTIGDTTRRALAGDDSAGQASGKTALALASAASDSYAAKFAAADKDSAALPLERLAGAAEQPDAPAGGVLPHAATHAAALADETNIATPLRERAWAGEFAQKIVWMAGNDKQSAQLTLNPPQMGPIDISLNLNKDGATAVFVSANAEVRDAIENALPRLREMLAGVGIELGQTNVGSEPFRQPSAGDSSARGTPRGADDTAILAAAASATTRAASAFGGRGMVDTFA